LLSLDHIYFKLTMVDCTGGSFSTEATKLDADVMTCLSPSEQAIKVLAEVEYMFVFFSRTTFSIDAPVIFDTGESLAIAPDRGDFIDDPEPLPLSNDLGIKGVGVVAWKFTAKYGSKVQIRTQAYWVPSAKSRLLSHQRLFNKKQGVLTR
jgi:hypothetical protein